MITKLKLVQWFQVDLRLRVLIIIALALCVFIAYSPLFSASWVYDDVNLVKPSPALKDVNGLLKSMSTDLYSQAGSRLEESAYWRPVAMVSYWLDTRFGNAPSALHVGNVVSHGLAVMLLAWVIMRRYGGRVGLVSAALASAWWALHPQNVEVVAWISCRYEILMVIALLGLLVIPWRRGALHAGIVGTVFLLGLLSKEGFAAMLAVVVAMDYAAKRSLRDIAPRWIAIIVALAVWMLLRAQIGLKGYDFPPLPAIIAIGLNYLEAIAIYSVRAFAFPPLTISHPLISNSLLAVIAGGFIFCAFAVAAFFWRERRLAVPVAIFLAGLVPMAGAITMFSEVPERYFYLPSIGLALCVAELLAFALSAPQRVVRIAMPSLFVLLVMVGLVVVEQRLPHWQNDKALWSSALRINPSDPQANYTMALSAGERGRWKEARRMMEIAAEGKPKSARIANAYAWVLLETGDIMAAVREAKRATELAPYQPNSWYYLAFALHKSGDHKGELVAVEKLLAVSPNYPRAREMRKVAACEASGRRGCLR